MAFCPGLYLFSSEGTSYRLGLTLIQSDLILPRLHLQRSYFQIRSPSQVLTGTEGQDLPPLGGHNSTCNPPLQKARRQKAVFTKLGGKGDTKPYKNHTTFSNIDQKTYSDTQRFRKCIACLSFLREKNYLRIKILNSGDITIKRKRQ